MSDVEAGKTLSEAVGESANKYLVRSVSDVPQIKDIFRFELWGVEQGIDYLIGVHRYISATEPAEEKLITLDGCIYSGSEHNEAIEHFCKLHDRISDIWRHSRRKDRYTPGYFIRWALELADVFQITWLDDARNQGLVPEKWLVKPASPSSFERVSEEKSLGKKEGYLLGIIAGLYYARYSMVSEDTVSSVQSDLALGGIDFDKRTIRGHLLAAIPLLAKQVADKDLQSK